MLQIRSVSHPNKLFCHSFVVWSGNNGWFSFPGVCCAVKTKVFPTNKVFGRENTMALPSRGVLFRSNASFASQQGVGRAKLCVIPSQKRVRTCQTAVSALLRVKERKTGLPPLNLSLFGHQGQQ
jgi:hypothetical protein